MGAVGRKGGHHGLSQGLGGAQGAQVHEAKQGDPIKSGQSGDEHQAQPQDFHHDGQAIGGGHVIAQARQGHDDDEDRADDVRRHRRQLIWQLP